MIGEMLSHYRVVEQIGSGGMGVVYRAHDEQLERDVALKIITPGTIADEDARSRFRKEALALAKLDHPNIATVFEFGSQDGVDFLVTAYIPGLTLDAKIAAKPLPEEEVISLGIQLAKGLIAAHDRGVIHCDLKPGNLRLTPDGLLKILDFGLAQFVDTSPDAQTISLASSSETTGTLPYMAPEQLRADPTDARTDIWASGAVLYELATGVRPFRDKQTAALIQSILNAEPKPPRQQNPAITPGLETIILKALDKSPARRYQSARELSVDLERLQTGNPLPRSKRNSKAVWAVALFGVVVLSLLGWLLSGRHRGSASKVRRSVAVLGFKNLSGKADEAWVSTALSEMLTTELAAGGQLRTIPGETVSRMKTDLSLPDSDSLASETVAKVYKVLGSDVVVLGSYLDVGGQLRIDFRVQDSTGETIATASEQGTQAQFFDLIKRVGGTLREKCGASGVTPQELETARASEPASTEAARYYAEGIASLRRFDALAARDSLQMAVQADPKHALAHSALAAAWSQLGYDQNALAESKRAFELSEKLPRGEKLAIEARFRENSHDWAKAADIYRSLWTFFPDDLDYGLRLVSAQVAAGQGQQALQTVQSLRGLPAPSRDDPRIDLAEALAAESLSDFKSEIVATTRARAKASGQGSRFLVAQALLDECWAKRNLGELDGARAAGEQAQAILSAAKDYRGQAGSLTCIANVLADQGKLDDAKARHEQALGLAQQVGAQKDIAGALINLGNIAAQRNLSDSTTYYQRALSVATAVADRDDMLSAQNNIAANLLAEGNFSEATKMFAAALDVARQLNDASSVVVAEINLASAHLKQGNFADAKHNLNDATTKAKQLDLKSSLASALAVAGDLAMTEDSLEAAESNYRQALAIRTQIGEQGLVGASQIEIAFLKLEKNDLKAAAEAAESAAAQFQEQHNDDQEALARSFLCKVKILQSDRDGAREEYERAGKLKVQDKALQLAVDINKARYLKASKANAAGMLQAVIESAKRMKLPGYELDARLALAEGSVPGLKALEKEASSKGYQLIARKAREVRGKLSSRAKPRDLEFLSGRRQKQIAGSRSIAVAI